MQRADPLQPIHHSLRAGKRVFAVKPRNMDSMPLNPESKMKLDAHALEIFTDCANAGLPFADCLGAVWLSGATFALKIKGTFSAPSIPLDEPKA